MKILSSRVRICINRKDCAYKGISLRSFAGQHKAGLRVNIDPQRSSARLFNEHFPFDILFLHFETSFGSGAHIKNSWRSSVETDAVVQNRIDML